MGQHTRGGYIEGATLSTGIDTNTLRNGTWLPGYSSASRIERLRHQDALRDAHEVAGRRVCRLRVGSQNADRLSPLERTQVDSTSWYLTLRHEEDEMFTVGQKLRPTMNALPGRKVRDR